MQHCRGHIFATTAAAAAAAIEETAGGEWCCTLSQPFQQITVLLVAFLGPLRPFKLNTSTTFCAA
jgi:hypothetical protein